MSLLTVNEILKTEALLLQAMKAHDIDQLDALLHDDLLFHTPDGQIITKAIDLQLHRSGDMVIDHIAASDYSVNIISNTAVVSLVVETSGRIGDQAMAGKFRYLRVWK